MNVERAPRSLGARVLLGSAGMVIVLLLLAFFLLPSTMVRAHCHPSRCLTKEQLLKAQNDVRTTAIQALGGIVLVSGAAVAFKQLRLGRDQLDHNRDTTRQEFESARQGQITERFSRAVDQLGNRNVAIRLG